MKVKTNVKAGNPQNIQVVNFNQQNGDGGSGFNSASFGNFQ